jgi:RNA polymerase sigma-70 factor (ECF subfamily)
MAYEGGGDRGKAERFRAAALPYLDDVYTLARYLWRNTADAEDAAQECYLRAFRHFETFRGGPIKPWLLAILRNVCRAEYARRGICSRRGQSRRSRTYIRRIVERGAALSGDGNPASTRQRKHAATDHKLPDVFRETLVLREVNDLSYREIADVTGVPVGTVMSRLARARAAACGVAGGGERLMTCDEAEVMLHALIDDELDAGHAREVETHAAGCARCAAQLASYCDLQQALRRSIDRAVPSAAATDRLTLLKGFALGSLLSAAAAASVTLVVLREDRDQRILSEAISAHLRSLQACCTPSFGRLSPAMTR